ncbi:hypothetical protein RLW55_17025 [Hyphomicrobium sp. B1]|uniref:hypothetical protein n=1 Tax=unclassified Hyphomicrobium TaxID=2619925 RepID=UPI000213F43A|nr:MULTISPECIES: hypothetical protein [unclassified Hyphomicrobium]CCB64921.1 protein of unknown function [Hyphomicrobium sp. MC1]
MDSGTPLPGSVLVDLYIRLRDEIDGGERNLDPNHKQRARIVMTILAASESVFDMVALEERVRASLADTLKPRPLAA